MARGIFLGLLVVCLDQVHILMALVVVHFVFIKNGLVPVDMPYQHAMARYKLVPALVLTVLHEEVFPFLLCMDDVCLLTVVEVRDCYVVLGGEPFRLDPSESIKFVCRVPLSSTEYAFGVYALLLSLVA